MKSYALAPLDLDPSRGSSLIEASASVLPSRLEWQLAPGERCVWDGRVVVIWRVLSGALASVLDEATGVMHEAPVDGLSALPARAGSQDLLAVNDMAWQRAVNLHRDFLPYVGVRALPKAIAAALSQRYDLSERHIKRLRHTHKNDPQPSSLLPAKKGRQAGLCLVDARTEEVMARTIVKFYARRERTSKAEVAMRIQALCRRLGIPVPAKNTVMLRLKRAHGYELEVARRGRPQASQQWEARPGSLKVTRPLELCQIDHTLVDLMVLSSDRSRVLGRPWLTLAMDVATRSILGYYLTMRAPSAVSVALCIEHATMPKTHENEGRPGRWPMYGKCEHILVDNGKDLRSVALTRGCEEHGIDLTWRPVKRPHFGGHIERLMGTFMRMVHGLRGTTFSNVAARGDYPSEQRAMMTLAELEEWLVTKICNYYHLKSHAGIGTAPLLAWEAGWTAPTGEIVLPPLVRRPAQFRLDFLPFEIRRLHRTGIDFYCSRYWHPDLAPWVGFEHNVMVRFHPHDLRCVWVRNEHGDFIELPAVAGRALGELTVISLTAEERKRLEKGIDEGFEATDHIEAHAEAEAKRHKRNSKQNKPSPGRGGRSRLPQASVAREKVVALPLPNRALITTEEYL